MLPTRGGSLQTLLPASLRVTTTPGSLHPWMASSLPSQTYRAIKWPTRPQACSRRSTHLHLQILAVCAPASRASEIPPRVRICAGGCSILSTFIRSHMLLLRHYMLTRELAWCLCRELFVDISGNYRIQADVLPTSLCYAGGKTTT